MYKIIPYTENDLIQIGARYHNTKRNYLLINPLQGKHIPVSPTESLDMFTTLGEKLYRKYPETKLVIGFAETATAIGAAVASMFPDCKYICTTRENFPGKEKLEFLEEHSHAAEQTLITENLKQYFNDTNTVIFVDDELSTGKTMRNILSQLKAAYPELNEKTLVIASLINRLDAANTELMAKEHIICESLIQIENIDYTNIVLPMLYEIKPARPVSRKKNTICQTIMSNPYTTIDPRIGTDIYNYDELCEKLTDVILRYAPQMLSKKIMIIGTEECMYPAIMIGKHLENIGYSVKTHSTTRSPIGIMDEPSYPIRNGYMLPSFYDMMRETYLYNVEPATDETVIIVTDAASPSDEAISALTTLLTEHGTTNMIIMKI